MLTLTNTLPNRKDRKMKTFEGPRQLRWRRKRTEEGKINKMCVSSQHIEKEGATLAATPLPFLSRLVRQAGQAASPRKPYFTGKPHKIPQMSYLRRRRFSDNNLNKKMQLSLRNRLKHKNVKNVDIAYFFRLYVHTKKNPFPSGSHVACREPVAIKIIGLLK